MQAGDLRARIGFAARASGGEGNEGSGEFPDTDTFVRWANIRPRLAGESVVAARQEGRTLVNLTVRRDAVTSTITTGFRARDVDTGTIYNLLSGIDPNEHTAQRGEWIEFLAEAGGRIA